MFLYNHVQHPNARQDLTPKIGRLGSFFGWARGKAGISNFSFEEFRVSFASHVRLEAHFCTRSPGVFQPKIIYGRSIIGGESFAK
jgi:hypothetical protein